jgi:hypothetical protein
MSYILLRPLRPELHGQDPFRQNADFNSGLRRHRTAGGHTLPFLKGHAHSVSNSVLNFQYRGRYNTGISKMSIPVFAGIEVFSRNIPLPLKKKVGNLMSKQQQNVYTV